jgi:hypothetical protein
MDGARLVELTTHADARGDLTPLESGAEVPFEVRRVYLIGAAPPGAVRGEHAISAHTMLTLTTGSVFVEVDNGAERATFELIAGGPALYVAPGVWLRVYGFAPGTAVVVLSSHAYADCTYFDAPQPGLLEPLAR